MYLPWNASRARQKAARQAQAERRGIVQALSHGHLSRRDLIRMGLFTGAGMLAPIRGLNPFVPNLRASSFDIPTGLPRSPLFGAPVFSQPMPRFDVLPRNPMSSLDYCPPTCESNQTAQRVDALLGGGVGPIEGRPPGPLWAHQRWEQFPPQVAVEVSQMGNKGPNTSYNPSVSSSQLNLLGMTPGAPIELRFHPQMPIQEENSVWTFNGTVPPKLLIGRYGEPILFRHYNRLPVDVRANNSFGAHHRDPRRRRVPVPQPLRGLPHDRPGRRDRARPRTGVRDPRPCVDCRIRPAAGHRPRPQGSDRDGARGQVPGGPHAEPESDARRGGRDRAPRRIAAVAAAVVVWRLTVI